MITVIAAPIGLGLVQYSKFLLLPYSYAMIVKPEGDVPPSPLWKTYSAILKIVYVISFLADVRTNRGTLLHDYRDSCCHHFGQVCSYVFAAC